MINVLENKDGIFGALSDSAKFTIEKLKDNGADKCAVSVSDIKKTEFNADGGEFSLLRTVYSSSAVLSAITGGRYATLKKNKKDKQSLENAANECIASAKTAEPDDARDFSDTDEKREFFSGTKTFDEEKLFMRSRELLEDISNRHPLIIVEEMIVSHTVGYSVYANHSGAIYKNVESYYEVELMYSAHKGETCTSFFCDGLVFDSLDAPIVSLCDIEKNLVSVENQLDTVTTKEKFIGDLILTPQMSSEFLGDLIGVTLSDSAVLSSSSAWLDREGEKVTSEKISVKCVPSDSKMIAPNRFTMDGYILKDGYVIENGVLKNFVISDYVARKTGRRYPALSLGACDIAGGDSSLESMIKNTKKGILLGRFSGGNVSSSGDFAGVAKNSFLIEDGKIVKAISETMISGNLISLFLNVIEISKEKTENGMTSSPYIHVCGVTVSGK